MEDFVNSFGKHIFRSSTSRMFTASLKDALLGKDRLRIVGPWFLICCHDWVSSKFREMWLVKGVVQQTLFFIHVAKTSVMSSPFSRAKGAMASVKLGRGFFKGLLTSFFQTVNSLQSSAFLFWAASNHPNTCEYIVLVLPPLQTASCYLDSFWGKIPKIFPLAYLHSNITESLNSFSPMPLALAEVGWKCLFNCSSSPLSLPTFELSRVNSAHPRTGK
jgi:hypothetical protein